MFISRINHCHWEWNACLNINICKWLDSNYNFQPLDVVDRGSETQPQVVENLNRFNLQDNGWEKQLQKNESNSADTEC